MKIGIVRTGGTISCAMKDGMLTPADVEIAPQYETRVWGEILSEQATLAVYADIAAFVRAFDTAEGIVVTHGTDTLVYSAAMLSFLLADFDKPVVLVSANKPYHQADGNGVRNLRGALAALPHLAPGVYVSYANGGETTKIHLGCRLIAQPVFSDRVDGMSSVIGVVTAAGAFRRLAETPARRPVKTRGLQQAIYMIQSYPTERFHVEPGAKAVIVTAYHSGTVRSEAVNSLALGTDVYIVGGRRTDAVYGSAAKLIPRVIDLDNITPAAAYCKAAIAYATQDPVAVMKTDICGEFFE